MTPGSFAHVTNLLIQIDTPISQCTLVDVLTYIYVNYNVNNNATISHIISQYIIYTLTLDY